MLLIGDAHTNNHQELAVCCDALLGEMNCEYRSKRASGRLGPIEIVSLRFEDLVALNRTWETQFKFLPLMREPVQVLSLFDYNSRAHVS